MINIPENQSASDSNNRQVDPLLRVLRDAQGKLNALGDTLIDGFIRHMNEMSSRIPPENASREVAEKFWKNLSAASEGLAKHRERAIRPILDAWRNATPEHQALLREPMTRILRERPAAIHATLQDPEYAEIATRASFYALERTPGDLQILGDMLGRFPRDAADAEIESLTRRMNDPDRSQNKVLREAFEGFLRRVEERR